MCTCVCVCVAVCVAVDGSIGNTQHRCTGLEDICSPNSGELSLQHLFSHCDTCSCKGRFLEHGPKVQDANYPTEQNIHQQTTNYIRTSDIIRLPIGARGFPVQDALIRYRIWFFARLTRQLM